MEKAPDTFLSHAMEANEMEPWTRDERSQAWPELKRGYHDRGGPVMVWGFELKHDITSTRALKPFVVNGGASDVATAKGLSIWVVIYQRHSRYLIWRVKHIASVAWGLWLSWKPDRAGFVAK